MFDVVVQLGVDEVTARASMEEVMELETALANVSINSYLVSLSKQNNRLQIILQLKLKQIHNLTVLYLLIMFLRLIREEPLGNKLKRGKFLLE